ncbi:MAG: YfhO family protein, partial [Candidatus Sumerlaeota bacterium]|nr:YfhO family protein [Candidatus Sumerlaeota bacterium]
AIDLWWVVIQMSVALAAMWWLASLRVAPLTALLGGLSIALSGNVVMRFAGGHPNLVACYPWGFLLAGAWNRWWDGRGRRFLVLSAIAWSLLLLSAHIQTSYQFAIWWGLLTIIGGGIRGRFAFRRWLRGTAFVVGLGSLAAAVLLFPQIEFGLLTPRNDFPLENLLTLFFPGCFGMGLSGVHSGAASPYLGRWYYGWEGALLLNPLILGCLILSWRMKRHKFMVRGLLVSTIVCFLLALGRQSPLYQMAYAILPGFRIFRCQGRLIAFALFGLVALACLGFDHYIRRSGTIPQKGAAGWQYKLLKISIVACVVGLLLLFWAHRHPDGMVGRMMQDIACAPLDGPSYEVFPHIPAGTSLDYIWEKPELSLRANVFIGAAVQTLKVWLVLLLLGMMAALNRVQRMFWILTLIFASLVFSFWGALPYTRRVDIGKSALPDNAIKTLRLTVGGERVILFGVGDRNLLIPYNIPIVGGYAAVLGQRLNTFLQVAFNHPTNSLEYQNNTWELKPQARWLGARAFIATDASINFPEFIKNIYDNGKVRIWRPPYNIPLAFVATGGVAASSYEEAASLLSDSRNAESNQIILETTGPIKPADAPFIPLNLERPHPAEIRVDLREAPAGWVIVLESLLPGWRAWVDGHPATIVPAEVAFMAVKIGEGAKELRMTYRPASFRFGLAISLLVAAFLVFELISKRKGSALHQRTLIVTAAIQRKRPPSRKKKR